MGATRFSKGCFILLVLIVIQAGMAKIYSTADSTRMQFEPPQPRPGQEVTVIYDPSSGPLSGEKEFFLIYGFTAWDTAIERQKQIRLEPRNGKFVVKLNLPPEATYIWCFGRGPKEDLEDTNDGAWWDSYLFTAEGIPVQGAR